MGKQIESEAREHTEATGHKTMYQATWWECRGCPAGREVKMEPIIVKCECGRKVYCSGFTTTCQCGADYNWQGLKLAPRSQWGEETGEVF